MSTESPLPLATPPPRHKPTKILRLMAAVSVLLLLAVLFLWRSSSSHRLTWLTPADLKPTALPRGLVQLKNKLITLVGPLLKRFRSDDQFVAVRANLLAVSSSATKQLELSIPFATNAAGMRAWILSPMEFKTFNTRITRINGAVSRFMPTIQNISGRQAQVATTQSIPANLNSTNAAAQAHLMVGAQIDLFPKVIRDAVSLKVAATSTQLLGWSSDGLPQIGTNLAVACRVVIPSGGGLVLDGGPKNAGGTNYWLIVSPWITNAKGQPLIK